MTKQKTFYITTPIYYVNDAPHIGHAYTTLACDTMARFKRLDGYEVKFLTGTDEHGQKVEKAASDAGMSPQDFVDKVSKTFRHLADEMQITNDDFIRTTEERHKKAAQHLWQELAKRDQIYLGSYAGWYSVRDEAFYAEGDLIGGNAPTGAPVEWVEEPSYFFKLSEYQDKLLKFYEENPDFITPESRRNEVISFVKGGLRDLSISRTSFSWGVPVPGDPKHIMYVWLDALTNYITALGYPDTDSTDFQKFWPEAVHVVGKDILRFHAVYWPAFLMAAGLPLPKKIVAHGWWTIEGVKMSKSLGNVVDPIGLIDIFGLDAVRYFLLREISFGQDGDFSLQSLINRYNSDLANSYGNLVQRVLSLIHKNCGGKIPSRPDKNSSEAFKGGPGCFEDADLLLLSTISRSLRPLDPLYEIPEDTANMLRDPDGTKGLLRYTFSFHKYIEKIWKLIALANQYVDEQKPWALKTTDPQRMEIVLYVLAATIRKIAILTQPILPIASAKILDQLAVPEEERTFAADDGDSIFVFKPGTSLPEPKGVFPRIEK